MSDPRPARVIHSTYWIANLKYSADVNLNPGAVVPSLVVSYQVHLVFPENPYTAVSWVTVLETSVLKAEHHVLPSVGAVVDEYVAWKNEAKTISEFHANVGKFPPTVAIVVVPALIATLFGIALLVVERIPAPPLHLAAVVASSQTT